MIEILTGSQVTFETSDGRKTGRVVATRSWDNLAFEVTVRSDDETWDVPVEMIVQ